MASLTRRDFVATVIAASSVGATSHVMDIAFGADPSVADSRPKDVHHQLLDIAAHQEVKRRATFAAVKTADQLAKVKAGLRQKFVQLIGGLPERDDAAPPSKVVGQIDGNDYTIEKLFYESLPGYFVPALLYRPKQVSGRLPAVLSPCGHSAVGKAEETYQTLHINLVKRGFVVLTYDPVGQGERSQFWDRETGKSRFNLTCGEHCVLGNPLYLLGMSLARFRIWDGIRGLDYLASRPEVDPLRLGCAGNSGGGTLTAYISALDSRVAAAAICCYITTLPRRMANRIQEDPESDPEQDIFGFVSEGIDHAGLLAMRAPRPTLLGTALHDFFPIEGARESFAEAKRLYEVLSAGERIEKVEADARHGLSQPLRIAVYRFFERWLAKRDAADASEEIPVKPRPASELAVCGDKQVNITFHSRPLLPLALEEFRRQPKQPKASLRKLLSLDMDLATPLVEQVSHGDREGAATFILINGNETGDWRDEKELLRATSGYRTVIVDPRGAGRQQLPMTVQGHDHADPLVGVEENIAYNAFLVGKSLLEMRVADVLAAIAQLSANTKSPRFVLCGRRDAALVASFAAALSPSVIGIAVEEMLLSFRPLFAAEGRPINAASILPRLLSHFGDVADVLAENPRLKVLIAAGQEKLSRDLQTVTAIDERYTKNPKRLADWLNTIGAANAR